MIIGFLVVALLIWVVGYLAISTSQKALQQSIGESSVSLAVEIMGQIDRAIYGDIETFQEYSKDLILQKLLLESNQGFEKLDDIQAYINKKEQEWTSVPKEELTPLMEELINNRLSKELREKIEYYKQEYGYEVFGEIFVTNKHGANIAQTGKTTDYRQDDEEWWQNAKKDGVYVEDVKYDESADIYSTAIGIRVEDNDGNFAGVIKAVLNVEEAINRIKKTETSTVHRPAEFKLVTKDGKIIYATEEFGFLQNLPIELSSVLHCEEGEPGHTPYFIAAGDNPGEGEELFAHVHSKGYRDYKGLGWIFIVERKAKEIFTPVAKLRNSILIISLTVTTLAVLLGLFISTSISKTVTNLRDAATTIGKGNLDARIEVKSNDEIGQLAASFNDMAGKLKESYAKLKESHAQLEERVSERTATLSSANVELEGEIEQRSLAQKTLEERIKELNCLFDLSKPVERPEISLEQIFGEMAPLIRKAYQEPDKTSVRVTFEGVQYKTNNFEKSELSQHAEVKIRGEKAGDIEVYYLGEKGENGQSPFLKEENDLLDAVAEHLGRTAERIRVREKLQLFRDLMNQSNDCIFITEPKWGRFLDVNEKVCDSLGYTREELLNMTVKDIDDSIADDAYWTKRAKEIREKGSMVLEGRHKRKDGTTFLVEINIKFIEQEKDSYMLAVARDITERKKAEEALRQAAKEWMTTFDSINDLVSIHDKDFKLVRANKAFADAFGTKPEELIGKTCYEITHGTKEPPTDCPHKQTFDTKKPQRAEFFEPHLGIYVETSTSPIFDENGEIIASVHIAKDITERKKAEEEQEKLLEKVESINKELKDFAYIVSHDLKAPLRGVKTLADWIMTDYADKLDDQGKEQIGLLGSRVDRMHKLIDGVLEYSRVGREKEKQVQVNLNELVPGIIDAIAPPENIAITVEGELPVVKCGQTRIMQVFQNLLSNAVKYTDTPKGKIKVGCVEEEGFWKFSIADNGPGIEEKDFERIFQMFQTLSPRDEFESTGVGLTVVKKIVEMYGGKIWVESKRGQGSTFFFTLPKQEKEMRVKNAKLETNTAR
jgi:PAS domain S-box-containing protein